MADEVASWICCGWLTTLEGVFNDLQAEAAEHSVVCNENSVRKAAKTGRKIHRHAQVVGVTTTGAALYRDLLASVNPCVVLVEEAAEIMEPQVLAALPDCVQQLVMIGDHEQLPPPVENFDMKRRGLDISMFQRLIESGHPHVVLHLQNRMRDEIAELLRVLRIYKKLETNPRTTRKNKAPGCVRTSLFFWSHSEPEAKSGFSYYNEAEARMVSHLAIWMAKQHNVGLDKVTVIAAYKEQVRLIRRQITQLFQQDDFARALPGSPLLPGQAEPGKKDERLRSPIRVESIDNFQGDENDIIIVSLVRSSPPTREGTLGQLIGHLRTRNRLCVAVSRARCGLYMVGNAALLQAKNDNWSKVINHLRKKNEVGTAIPLVCERHPRSFGDIEASRKFSLECGVCRERCKELMRCGKHQCPSECHDHFQFSAAICKVEVKFTYDRCGHEGRKPCFQREEDVPCQRLCERELQCRHRCPLKCHENCREARCRECWEDERKEYTKRKKEEAEFEAKRRRSGELKRNPFLDRAIVTEINRDGNGSFDYRHVEGMMKSRSMSEDSSTVRIDKIEEVTVSSQMRARWESFQAEMVPSTAKPRLMFLYSKKTSLTADGLDGFGNEFPVKERDETSVCREGEVSFTLEPYWSVPHPSNNDVQLAMLYEVLIGEEMNTWDFAENPVACHADLRHHHSADSIVHHAAPDGDAGSQELSDSCVQKYIVLDRHQALPKFIVHFRLCKNKVLDLLRSLPVSMKVR